MAHGNSPRHKRRPKKAAAKKTARPKSNAPDGSQARASAAKTSRIPAGAGPKGEPIRLQKLLAAAGFGSRREVEKFLSDERVTVNGRVASLGDRADPFHDEVKVDGEKLARERPVYWILNKPRGVVTTVRDEAGRRKVTDLLPSSIGRVFPVGRLDRETSGLLLLTNDGDLAHVLLHPSLGNEREYKVSVKGEIDRRAIDHLERGVRLEEGLTSPARVSGVRYDPDSGTSSLSLTLGEGRKRQIRRSLLVLGFPVRRLVRVRMGPIRIGRLAVGEARPLRSPERRALLDHVERLRNGEAPAPPTAPKSQAARANERKPRSQRGTSGPRRSGPPNGPASKRAAPARRSQSASGKASHSGSSGAGRASTGRRNPRDWDDAPGDELGRKRPVGSRSASGRSGLNRAPAKRKGAAKKGARKKASRKKSAARKGSARKSSARKPTQSKAPAGGRSQRPTSSRKGTRK